MQRLCFGWSALRDRPYRPEWPLALLSAPLCRPRPASTPPSRQRARLARPRLQSAVRPSSHPSRFHIISLEENPLSRFVESPPGSAFTSRTLPSRNGIQRLGNGC